MFRFRCPTFKSRKAAKWGATFSVTEPPTPMRLYNILSLNFKTIWKSNDNTFANEVVNILSSKFESIWKSNDKLWQQGCKQSLPKLSLEISWKQIQINNQVCENLSNGSFSEEQKQVQKITANVDMYSDLMKQVFWKYLNTSTLSEFQVPLMVFALFLGPWSDRAGRKLLIAFPFFGNCLTCLGFLANVYFFDQLYVEFLWIGEVAISTLFLSRIVCLRLWAPCLGTGWSFSWGFMVMWLTTLL